MSFVLLRFEWPVQIHTNELAKTNLTDGLSVVSPETSINVLFSVTPASFSATHLTNPLCPTVACPTIKLLLPGM